MSRTRSDRFCLEAMLVIDSQSILKIEKTFGDIGFAVTSIGGKLQTNIYNHNIIQLQLFIPYFSNPQTMTSLSHREQEVIQLLAEGLRGREISQKLFISDRTVKFHINNVVTKLNAKTRIQAIHQVYLQGLLTSVFIK